MMACTTYRFAENSSVESGWTNVLCYEREYLFIIIISIFKRSFVIKFDETETTDTV